MKLAKVKVEYTGGTTITERVTLDPMTGKVTLPPRLVALLETMDQVECSPAFGLDYEGFTLPVSVASDGTYSVAIPQESYRGLERVLNAIAYPSKDQRQQNARYLHTLSAVSVGGLVGYVHAASRLDYSTVAGAAILAALAVLLWYPGFTGMKGD